MKVRITRVMMLAAIAGVLVAGSRAAWAQEAGCPASPNYSPDFSSNHSCLTLNGNLNGVTPNPQPGAAYPTFLGDGSTFLRLTPNAGGWATSAWYFTQQPVSKAFSTTFTFQITGPSSSNADGFAFLIQNSSLNALGYRGCGVGFGYDPAGFGCSLTDPSNGIPNSLAVEFKTYNDGYPAPYPNTANSVSIMSNGTAANCIDYQCLIAANNSLQVAGSVTTSGTTVTWANGSQFNPSWAAGTVIVINGVSYSIASVASPTSLSVTNSTGMNTSPVAYSVAINVGGAVTTTGTTTVHWASGGLFNIAWDPGTQILINGVAYTIVSVTSPTSLTVAVAAPPFPSAVPYSVGTILTDGNVHTATISYTLQPTAAASPNCFYGEAHTPEPCLDVILDGNDLFNGGVPLMLGDSGPIDLGTMIGGAGNATSAAWVGFTAGNAGGFDNEDILSWTFTPQSTSQSGTVSPGQTSPTVFNFNGGYAQDSGGFDYTALDTNSDPNSPSFAAVTTAIPTDLATCNSIIGPTGGTFQGAKCFVYQFGPTPDATKDSPVMFELTCPTSPGQQCGSVALQPFLAQLGSDFSFDVGENPPLDLVNSNPSIMPYGPLQAMGGNPYVGFLKGEGPDSSDPCKPFPPGDIRNATMFSNQIISFNLVDTGSKPVTAGSGGTGSCWIVVYLTSDETPTVSIAQPANGGFYLQGQNDPTTKAAYACTTMYNGLPTPTGGVYPAMGATGPYLTGTCSANDSPGGSIGQGGQFDTSTIGTHSFTATVLDSATNTASQTVTYTVQGTQTIMLSGVPASAAFNTTFTVGATGGGSGNPVTFTSSGACTNIGATYKMTNSTGICSVIANQAGNANYLPAVQVTAFVNATGPLLTVTPTNFSFGTVNFGLDLNPAVVTVKNIGTATANISNVSLTLGPGTNAIDFTKINLCPSSLAAGKSCSIAVIFYSGNLGAVSATLKITDNSPGSPQQVPLSANIIGFTPSSLNFGTIKVGHSSTLSVTLNNTGTTALSIGNVGIAGANAHDFVKNSGCPSSLGAGLSCSISVTFTPSATGTRSGALTLSDNVPLNTLVAPLMGKGN